MAAEHDISTWPRRGEAAKRLGISVATLRRYEGKLIIPIKDKNGEHRFDPQELEALAARLKKRGVRKAAAQARTDAPRPAPSRDVPPPESRVSGVNTKRAFEMFEQNYSRARVVIELGESVENVDWLNERYLVMSGKMNAEAAQRLVRGVGVPTAPTREERPAAREISDAEILAAPIALLDETDRARRKWIGQINARKQRYEEAWRAVLAERVAATPTRDVGAQTMDDEELRARPRESLTRAESELVVLIEEERDRDRPFRSAC
jgi:DNA-binding transcriptional MerR regulator